MASRVRTTPAPPARRPTAPAVSGPPPAVPAERCAGPARTVALAALLAYANSLGNGFVWDDPIILTRQLVVFRTVGDVLSPPRDIPAVQPRLLSPADHRRRTCSTAPSAATRRSSFTSPSCSRTRATSALRLRCSLCSCSAAPRRAVARRRRAPVLLFALHPIHTESVAWAAGRSDVLATGFLLAALVMHGRRPWSWRAGAGRAVRRRRARREGDRHGAVSADGAARRARARPAPERAPTGCAPMPARWLAGVVYVLLRRHALGEFVGSTPDALPAGQRSPLELMGAVGVYVEKLLWPAALNAYIDHIDSGPLRVALAASSPSPALPSPCAGWRTRATGRPLFALAWMALTLVPSLAILWKIPDAPLAERYLYLPSVGFCLLAGDLAARAWRRAAAAGAPRRWLGARRAARRGRDRDRAAQSGLARRRRALGGHRAEEPGVGHGGAQPRHRVSAGRPYRRGPRRLRARPAAPQHPRGLQTIYNNLGTLAMYDRDYAAAQRHYEAALAANPNAPDTLFNLGLAVLQRGGAAPEAARRGAALLRARARASTRTMPTSKPRSPRPTRCSATTPPPPATPAPRSTSARRERRPTACARCWAMRRSAKTEAPREQRTSTRAREYGLGA